MINRKFLICLIFGHKESKEDYYCIRCNSFLYKPENDPVMEKSLTMGWNQISTPTTMRIFKERLFYWDEDKVTFSWHIRMVLLIWMCFSIVIWFACEGKYTLFQIYTAPIIGIFDMAINLINTVPKLKIF